MMVLELNMRYLTFLGVDVDARHHTSFARKFRLGFFLLGNLYSLGICCVIYWFLHFTNLESSANELMVTAATLSSVTSLLSFAVKTKQIRKLCHEFQVIADRGLCESSIHLSNPNNTVIVP